MASVQSGTNISKSGSNMGREPSASKLTGSHAQAKHLEHQREKERIRRLKCKVLKLVEELRDRSSGHLLYIQNRMKDSDFKVLEKKRMREMKFSHQASKVRSYYLGKSSSVKTISFNNTSFDPDQKELESLQKQAALKKSMTKVPKAPPLFFGNPDNESERAELPPAKVNLIDELVKHLSIEEIDTIAEDPVFYFPFRDDGKYAEVQDVERWNAIADTLVGRIQPRIKVLKPSDQQPGVLRLYPSLQKLDRQVSKPKELDAGATPQQLQEFNKKLERAAKKHNEEIEKVSLIAELSLQQQQARVARNQKMLAEEHKKQQEKLFHAMQQKEMNGTKAIEHQIHLGIRRRKENTFRTEMRLQKLEEHFRLQSYQEEMIKLSEIIKDKAKRVGLELRTTAPVPELSQSKH